MSFVAYQSRQEKTVSLISRFQHLFFAVCIVIGIVATLAMVATSPQYYSLQNGAVSVFVTFAAANTMLMQAHLIAGVLTVYLLPLSLLAMAWLALRRSPWFTSIVMLLVFIGLCPIGVYSGQDALNNDLSHMGSNPLFLLISQQFNNDGVMSYYNVIFILGTVVGPTLIGIALWRTRTVPIWAAVFITFSRPLVLLYPFLSGLPAIYIQLLSWVLLLIGSIPAALAMAKGPDNEHQLTQEK